MAYSFYAKDRTGGLTMELIGPVVNDAPPMRARSCTRNPIMVDLNRSALFICTRNRAIALALAPAHGRSGFATMRPMTGARRKTSSKQTQALKPTHLTPGMSPADFRSEPSGRNSQQIGDDELETKAPKCKRVLSLRTGFRNVPSSAVRYAESRSMQFHHQTIRPDLR